MKIDLFFIRTAQIINYLWGACYIYDRFTQNSDFFPPLTSHLLLVSFAVLEYVIQNEKRYRNNLEETNDL